MFARSFGVPLVFALAACGTACQSDRDFVERVNSDTWSQAENNEVDILFVIDNSCSMADEQATLAAGFTSFAEQLDASGTDFHLGAITTGFRYDDPTRGVLIGSPPYLTAEDDYLAEFQQRTQVGVDGPDKEKGLEASVYAVSAIMTTGPNRGFVRPEANLVVVYVSDEEDCSDGGALEGLAAEACYLQRDRLTPVGELVLDLRAAKARPDQVVVGAIVGQEGSGCLDVYPGRRYMQAVSLTGGLVQDICEGDWGEMLAELGLTATGVRASFELSQGAKEGTLEVFVNGQRVAEDTVSGWTYDPATWFITFGRLAIPPRGATITANYAVQPGPRPVVDDA